MTDFFRRLPALLALLFLLTACSFPGNRGNVTGTTPTATPTHLSSLLLTPTAATNAIDDTCMSAFGKNLSCLIPHALRRAYGVEPLVERGFTGKGQTVIDIVSFGSPTLQKDMDVFSRKFNLPSTTIDVISPLHVPEYDPQGDKAGWADETTLDVEIIHAIAPDAKIVVLVSPVAETEGTIGLPEFRQLIQYAIDHKLGNIMSQSWGASELTLQDQKGQQELRQWDALLQNATTQHAMTFFSASGDHGSTDYSDLQGMKLARVPTTGFAADSPWVTSVGGTTLVRRDPAFTEHVWNDGVAGSGGGFSIFYKTPSYQQTLPTSIRQQLNNRRGVPDVAADADPRTGLAYYINGRWQLAGGTSASTPVWAGIMAIANQMAGHPLGFINPALYKLAQSGTYNQDFHDITVGDNTNQIVKVPGYSAAPGWDAATGLGTPNAERLLPDLIATMQA